MKLSEATLARELRWYLTITLLLAAQYSETAHVHEAEPVQPADQAVCLICTVASPTEGIAASTSILLASEPVADSHPLTSPKADECQSPANPGHIRAPPRHS